MLFSVYSFSVSSYPWESFYYALVRTVSTTGSFTLVLVINGGSTDEQLSNTPDLHFGGTISERGGTLSPFRQVVTGPLLSAPHSWDAPSGDFSISTGSIHT